MLLVVTGVGVTLYTAPAPVKPAAQRPTTNPMREMAVGTDEFMEDVDPVADAEKTLEKLLSDSGVDIPVAKKRPVRSKEAGREAAADVGRI